MDSGSEKGSARGKETGKGTAREKGSATDLD
jgi:hypothetical protein